MVIPRSSRYFDMLKGAHMLYVHVVPTPAGYVLQTEATDIPETNLRRITVTFYGDPAEKQAEAKQHELEQELREKGVTEPHVTRENATTQVPFFTNPTACSNGPQVASIYMDAWEAPGTWRTPGHDPEITTGEVNSLSTPVLSGPGAHGWVSDISKSPAVSGCNVLSFTPANGSQPTTHEAESPPALNSNSKPAPDRDVRYQRDPRAEGPTIKFPQGMTVDPSAADGLGVCTLAQIGYEGAVPATTVNC